MLNEIFFKLSGSPLRQELSDWAQIQLSPSTAGSHPEAEAGN